MDDAQGDQPAERLHGWAQIEDLYKHLDQKMVDGFNSDIDTLLVFAGLFSAVLTAFLMQSSTLLQVDDSQRTVDLLAQLVAHQIGNLSNQPVAQSAPFTPSSPSILINSLWYLSLVLSLASALFGMMAKPWLREYMQWTTMSTLPVDAVHLRQLRYEAFLDWKTPGLLACIPVLLELAVVLFSVGMVVHLFTLNAIVAGICTVAVAIVLALTVLSFILPVSFPRCPYKSPAGWGLVLLMRNCASLWDMLRSRMSLISGLWSNPGMPVGFQPLVISDVHTDKPLEDWRTRDLELQPRGGVEGGILQLYHNASIVPSASDEPQLSKKATRIYALSRALLWVQETSKDRQLLASVTECCKMPNPPTTQVNDLVDVLILDYVVVCDRLHVSVNAMRAYLHAINRNNFGMNPLAGFQATQDSPLQLEQDVIDKIFRTPLMVRAVLVDILSGTVLQSLGYFSPGASADLVWATPRVVDQLLLCGAIITLEFNSSVQTRDTRRLEACMNNFKSIFDLLSKNKELCQKLPGVRGVLLHFMFEWEQRQSSNFTMIAQSSGFDAYATLACQILAGNPSELTHDDCDVFIRVSSFALQKAWSRDAHRLQDLLACMKTCVDCSIERHWRNRGSYSTQDPWTAGPYSPLYRLFHPRGRRYTRDMDRIYPHALIDALNRCSAAVQDRTAELQALIERSAELLRAADEAETKAIPIVNQAKTDEKAVDLMEG